MKSVRHRLIGLATASTVILLLSGCGGSTPSEAAPASEPDDSAIPSATLYYVEYTEDDSSGRLLSWDGETVTEVVAGTVSLYNSAYVSPSGEYVSWIDTPQYPDGELVIYHLADGTEEIRSTFQLGGEHCVTPRWVPGGNELVVGVDNTWDPLVLYNVDSDTSSEEFSIPSCNPIPTETGIYYWDHEADDIAYLTPGEEPTLTGAGPAAAAELNGEIKGLSSVSADGNQACVVVAAQHNDGMRGSREPSCEALISTEDGTVLAPATGLANEQRVFGPDGGHVYRSAGEVHFTGADLTVTASFAEPPELVQTTFIGYTV